MHAEYFHQLQFIVEVSFDHEKEKEKRFDPGKESDYQACVLDQDIIYVS